MGAEITGDIHLQLIQDDQLLCDSNPSSLKGEHKSRTVGKREIEDTVRVPWHLSRKRHWIFFPLDNRAVCNFASGHGISTWVCNELSEYLGM